MTSFEFNVLLFYLFLNKLLSSFGLLKLLYCVIGQFRNVFDDTITIIFKISP